MANTLKWIIVRDKKILFKYIQDLKEKSGQLNSCLYGIPVILNENFDEDYIIFEYPDHVKVFNGKSMIMMEKNLCKYQELNPFKHIFKEEENTIWGLRYGIFN